MLRDLELEKNKFGAHSDLMARIANCHIVTRASAVRDVTRVHGSIALVSHQCIPLIRYRIKGDN